MPDTDDVDAAAERYWPEEYKWVIRDDLRRAVEASLKEQKAFEGIYQKTFPERFNSYEDFIRRLGELVVIGAENGIDDILEEIHRALHRNQPLPEKRFYAIYFWPEPFDEGLKNSLHREIFEEFGTHHSYRHIHEDHYETQLSFDEFVDQVAQLAVSGAMNGADKALGEIYGAFLFGASLPVFRRRPKRVR